MIITKFCVSMRNLELMTTHLLLPVLLTEGSNHPQAAECHRYPEPSTSDLSTSLTGSTQVW